MKILRRLTCIAAALLTLAGSPTAQTLTPAEFVDYAPVRLTSDLGHLSSNQKAAIKEMIAASEVMDGLFWKQAYGDPRSLSSLTQDKTLLDYARINYGPWDRLQGNRPFIPGVGEKPPGAQFYPADMTKEEFEAARLPGEKDLYSVVRRDAKGKLYTVPYSLAYGTDLAKAADHIRKAADLVGEPQLQAYLMARADALESNDYQPSDMLWMDMKENSLDLVIGPIETYEDRLYGYRAAFEAYVLVKDKQWSQKLARYSRFLPDLQRDLPVPPEYKTETPGTDSDLNAYDVVYYAGDCNAGSKTIAINLPNDEEVQLRKGSRRLQLKNAMRAKYDKIMLPIAQVLIVPEQRKLITFDAFFANTMFHEVAHGLGIKKVITPGLDLEVDEALKELSGTMEEGKADMLGVFMIEGLTERGELPADELDDQYVTYMAGIFRSIRFGASSAHGVANLARFNFFRERGAFTRNEQGLYRVNLEKMKSANQELTAITLKIQGDGDYDGAKAFLGKYGVVSPELQADLDRLKAIPTDIVFEQGVQVLKL
jgi:hypothetical protein